LEVIVGIFAGGIGHGPGAIHEIIGIAGGIGLEGLVVAARLAARHPIGSAQPQAVDLILEAVHEGHVGYFPRGGEGREIAPFLIDAKA